jgi:hypothetical protein
VNIGARAMQADVKNYEDLCVLFSKDAEKNKYTKERLAEFASERDSLKGKLTKIGYFDYDALNKECKSITDTINLTKDEKKVIVDGIALLKAKLPVATTTEAAAIQLDIDAANKKIKDGNPKLTTAEKDARRARLVIVNKMIDEKFPDIPQLVRISGDTPITIALLLSDLTTQLLTHGLQSASREGGSTVHVSHIADPSVCSMLLYPLIAGNVRFKNACELARIKNTEEELRRFVKHVDDDLPAQERRKQPNAERISQIVGKWPIKGVESEITTPNVGVAFDSYIGKEFRDICKATVWHNAKNETLTMRLDKGVKVFISDILVDAIARIAELLVLKKTEDGTQTLQVSSVYNIMKVLLVLGQKEAGAGTLSFNKLKTDYEARTAKMREAKAKATIERKAAKAKVVDVKPEAKAEVKAVESKTEVKPEAK